MALPVDGWVIPDPHGRDVLSKFVLAASTGTHAADPGKDEGQALSVTKLNCPATSDVPGACSREAACADETLLTVPIPPDAPILTAPWGP